VHRRHAARVGGTAATARLLEQELRHGAVAVRHRELQHARRHRATARLGELGKERARQAQVTLARRRVQERLSTAARRRVAAALEQQLAGGGVRGRAHAHGEGQRRLASGVGRGHLDVLLLEQQPHHVGVPATRRQVQWGLVVLGDHGPRLAFLLLAPPLAAPPLPPSPPPGRPVLVFLPLLLPRLTLGLTTLVPPLLCLRRLAALLLARPRPPAPLLPRHLGAHLGTHLQQHLGEADRPLRGREVQWRQPLLVAAGQRHAHGHRPTAGGALVIHQRPPPARPAVAARRARSQRLEGEGLDHPLRQLVIVCARSVEGRVAVAAPANHRRARLHESLCSSDVAGRRRQVECGVARRADRAVRCPVLKQQAHHRSLALLGSDVQRAYASLGRANVGLGAKAEEALHDPLRLVSPSDRTVQWREVGVGALRH